jgi:small subunit ribosomal protein S21
LIEVKVRKNNIEKALREFKRKVKDSKLMLELSENSYYTKPSVKKRRQKLLAKLRFKQNTEKDNNIN